ncbi:XK-related protein 8-like [Odontesthes bonariensis]|uniref:XK-related protein 8-like n=1 Tax=Odontesthes bonariensis TaxID=219752 RepID=UPI003F586E41
MAVFRYSLSDFLFACFGLLLHLLDIGLDVWAAVNFYQEGAYASLAVLLLLLLSSSVLVQVFSWFWYSYDNFEMQTKVEKWLSGRLKLLKLLHVLQLGIYVRYAGVLETSVRSLCSPQSDLESDPESDPEGDPESDPEGDPESDPEGVAVYLSQDLSLLLIIETFSESAPQVVLMLTVILQEGRLSSSSVLKAVGSVAAVALALSVTTHHRNMRYFLPDGAQRRRLGSSVVYFLCNLLLLSSRLLALALFASVLPCFIFIHFVCSWLVFFFCAWRFGTEFMESAGGEWTYRATVALIWYFDWFNMTKVSTRRLTQLYHGCVLLDVSVLCGVWCWEMATDPPRFAIPPLYARVTAAGVVALYVLGLLLKVVYYMCFHPNLPPEEQLRGGRWERLQGDEIDGLQADCDVTDRSMSAACNRRMKKVAENFYS